MKIAQGQKGSSMRPEGGSNAPPNLEPLDRVDPVARHAMAGVVRKIRSKTGPRYSVWRTGGAVHFPTVRAITDATRVWTEGRCATGAHDVTLSVGAVDVHSRAASRARHWNGRALLAVSRTVGVSRDPAQEKRQAILVGAAR